MGPRRHSMKDNRMLHAAVREQMANEATFSRTTSRKLAMKFGTSHGVVESVAAYERGVLDGEEKAMPEGNTAARLIGPQSRRIGILSVTLRQLIEAIERDDSVDMTPLWERAKQVLADSTIVAESNIEPQVEDLERRLELAESRLLLIRAVLLNGIDQLALSGDWESPA